jgi:hypothetical protein
MSGTVILAIVLAVIVVAGAAALAIGGGRAIPGSARDLRRRFGPEYDRVAQEHGGPKAAERELAERVREHDSLTLRPLARDERERYASTWSGVQARFVDDPAGAVQQADQVIGGLMTAIGYPSQDRGRQLELASVDHAHALGDYRQARELALGGSRRDGHRDGDGEGADASIDERADSRTTGTGTGTGAGTADTERLRQAVLHYRVMFRELLESSADFNASSDSNAGSARERVGR